MNLKLFTAVSTIGGVGVGGTLYLLTSGNSSGVASQTSPSSTVSLTRTTQSNEQQEQKSVAKGECTVIDLPQEIQTFLGDKYTGKDDYVAVSCKNTKVRSDYTPLDSEWMGWFPKFVFSSSSSTTKDSKLEITTEIKFEEDGGGSYTEVSFVGSGLTRTFKAKLEPVSSPNLLGKDVSTASVWGGEEYKNKLIYLFVPKTVVSGEQN